MSYRGNYRGRRFDPNYRNRGRGRGGNFAASSNSFQSEGGNINPVGRNANQTQPTTVRNMGGKQVSMDGVEPSVAAKSSGKKKGGRRPKKKNFQASGSKQNKLGKTTKLSLDTKTIDFRRSRTNYFCPPFGPLQEVYHYLKPRMRQYFNDYARSIQTDILNYSFEFFYQSFAFRVSELYLSKIWLFAAPDRFLSAHYDQIKGLLNSIQPLIKEMIQDVSQYLGNFELHDKFWVNKFPLLVMSHHWLQAAYGYCSPLPFKHLNQREGLRAVEMSHLPIVITKVGDNWPIRQDMLEVLADGSVNYLSFNINPDSNLACSLYLQQWLLEECNPRDINNLTFYLFNGMVNPGDDIYDWLNIPTNVNNAQFDYHVGEDNPLEVHPTLFQAQANFVTRPVLTRFFPWRTSGRTKSHFIIQFNCEFLRDTYNAKYSREGVEDISMPLASTLLQLIGCEIDSWLDYWGAEFIAPVGDPALNNWLKFKWKFAIREPGGFDFNTLNGIAAGTVLVQYVSDGGVPTREPLPMRLRYKLPLWYHAYRDFDTLNEMNGFFHPVDGVGDDGNVIDDDQYDIEYHWWRWCMAGIYPRWCPYRIIISDLETHWNSASQNVQLDFLKTEIPVSTYKMPDFSGSSVQISRWYTSGQSENIVHLTDSPEGELNNGFIITDRANWIHPTTVGPWNRDFTWLTHFEGLDQVRKIKDIIATFFPQSAWTISNDKR